MRKRHFLIRHALVALGLVALALTQRYGISPWLERLPVDYANEMHYVTESQFRESPNAAWTVLTPDGRRTDHALTASGDVVIIQGNLLWSTESGEALFETNKLYGADRHTRQNTSGFGDAERTGQYLFPPHVQPTTYTYWDQQYIGPRTATFDGTETVDGLSTYVFNFTTTGLDETEGYSNLQDVPERFDAHTDGHGRLWIEPLSGVVVQYEEHGVSYFVDRKTGEQRGDLHRWSAHYTPETQADQLSRARSTRWRMLLYEAGLPAGLLLAGFLWLAVGAGRGFRR